MENDFFKKWRNVVPIPIKMYHNGTIYQMETICCWKMDQKHCYIITTDADYQDEQMIYFLFD